VKANIYTFFHGRNLQPWYRILIEERDGSKHVTFCSRIHVHKEVTASFSYDAKCFTDYQILNDHSLVTWVYDRYGADIFVT
jgi:hypothetical protein